MKFKYDKQKEKLILTEASRIEVNQLNLWLTRHPKGYRFTPQYKMRVWDGKERYIKNGEVNLGLWKECMNAATVIGTNFVIENKEDFPVNRDITLEKVQAWSDEFFKNHYIIKGEEKIKFTPRDYQIETAFKILRNRYCLAEVATSGGKSLILSMVLLYYIQNINPDGKMLLIVPNISLVTQFYDNLIEFAYGFTDNYNKVTKVYNLILENDKFLSFNENNIVTTNKGETLAQNVAVGDNINGVKIKEITLEEIEPFVRIEEVMSDKPRKFTGVNNPNVYIGTYQSLEKWPKDFFKQFDIVAVDESHKAKGSTIKKILSQTFGHAKVRVGVSGTFPDDDSCEILNIQSVIGPKVTQVEASKLIEDGSITPLQVKAVILNHNEPGIWKRLRSAKTLNNGSEIYNVEKKYFQESEHRLNFINKLVKDKCKDNSMVLFHNVEYGRRIYEKLKENPDIDVYYIDGEVSSKERTQIIEEMNKTDRIKILVSSYGTTATGLSINSIFNVVFADSFKSESLVIQAIGRALRKFNGKDLATIYDIVDIFDPKDMTNAIYKHFKEREKMYVKRKYPYQTYKVNLNKE